MKVKEIIKKYRLCSNADVFVEAIKNQSVLQLTQTQMDKLEPEYLMDMRVNSFDVVDNVLTIYAE